MQTLKVKLYPIILFLIAVFAITSCKKSSSDVIIPSENSVAKSHYISVAKTHNIVVLGASSAYGIGATPIDSGWVNRLRSTLIQNGKKVNITNLSTPGYTTYHCLPIEYSVAGRPKPDTARNIVKALKLNPELVIINYPTNDAANNIPKEETLKNYLLLTKKLDSASVSYIIMGSQPRNLNDVQRLQLRAINDALRLYYADHFDDVFDLLGTSNYTLKPYLDSGDAIHVNNLGHYLIMQTIMQHAIFKKVMF